MDPACARETARMIAARIGSFMSQTISQKKPPLALDREQLSRRLIVAAAVLQPTQGTNRPPFLNLVERWFAELTNKAVRRGSFASVPDLVATIEEFIQENNKTGKPFVWKATAEQLLAKYERCRNRLEQISPGCTAPRRKKNVMP